MMSKAPIENLKVYVASSFKLKDRVIAVEKALEQAGYVLHCKWWNNLDYIPSENRTLNEKSNFVSNEEFYSSPGCETAFKRDLNAVFDADVFVLVCGDTPRAFNGANIELGIAIGRDLKCFSIGKLDNSALYYPVKRCSGIEDLLWNISSHFTEVIKQKQQSQDWDKDDYPAPIELCSSFDSKSSAHQSNKMEE